MPQLQVQSNADYSKVRDFFIRYQDRLMYGTDITQSREGARTARHGSSEAEPSFVYSTDRTWRMHWKYLATPLSQHVDSIHADTKGLALPRGVIDKIYYLNAGRIFHLDH
jgi:hypothetical protein